MPLPPSHRAIQERTEQWLAAADPVGRLEEALIAAAHEQDITVRVMARDGDRLPQRADRRPGRVNVEIADGRVTRIDGVY